MSVKSTGPKTATEISKQWDDVAKVREDILKSGQDPSFNNILAPHVLDQFVLSDNSFVLDVGSGTGELTAKLAKRSLKLIAIEPSRSSIEIARNKDTETLVEYFVGTIEEYASKNREIEATTVVLSMTIMCCPNLETFVAALSTVTAPNCRVIVTLTHPCFWPRYWNYESEPWFTYNEEIFVEAPFKTSVYKTNFLTTHVHRPLLKYVNTFKKNGFSLINTAELGADSNLDADSLIEKYPRFLSMIWEKSATEFG